MGASAVVDDMNGQATTEAVANYRQALLQETDGLSAADLQKLLEDWYFFGLPVW